MKKIKIIAGMAALSSVLSLPLLAQKSSPDIFLDKCSICHGTDGAGKTAKGKKLKVKDIHETLAKMSEAEMIKVVTEGKGKDMDGFGKDFKPAEIKGLVDYYRSLGK